MRSCVCCGHPKREEIDAKLKAGESIAHVAEEYGLSKSAVQRHRTNHLGLAFFAATTPTGGIRASSLALAAQGQAEALAQAAQDKQQPPLGVVYTDPTGAEHVLAETKDPEHDIFDELSNVEADICKFKRKVWERLEKSLADDEDGKAILWAREYRGILDLIFRANVIARFGQGGLQALGKASESLTPAIEDAIDQIRQDALEHAV